MINSSQIPLIDSSTHLQIIESPTSPKATRYTCQKAMGKACIVTSVACAILGGSAAIGALASGLIGSSPKCGVLAGLHSGSAFLPCALAVIYCVHRLGRDHVQHKQLMRITYFALSTIGVLLPMLLALLACRDAHSRTPFCAEPVALPDNSTDSFSIDSIPGLLIRRGLYRGATLIKKTENATNIDLLE